MLLVARQAADAASLMCVPPGRCQFNGTETLAHCNCLPQLFQAIRACPTAPTASATGLAAASAAGASGSAAAINAQIVLSRSRTFRILTPRG
jgi:hypothetical protein